MKQASFIQLETRQLWCVCGLVFDAVSLKETKLKITQAIKQDISCFLTTPNLNFLITAISDDEFYQSVIDSDLSIADGMPLIWVAKLLGLPLTERVAGSTLFDELSKKEAKADKIKVFFFGGQEGVAENAHQQLNITSDGMTSCGFYDPGFVTIDEMSSSTIVDKINAADPDFLVVALGAKKGQAWIQKNREQLNATVISHLGAVINFVAGSVERAPLMWQRIGLEWVWRIKQEPTLWQRYFFDGLSFLKLLVSKVLPLAVYDRWLKRSASFHTPFECHYEQSKTLITLIGSVHYDVIGHLKDTLSQVVVINENIIIDCSKLIYLDSAVIATLLLFQRHVNESGHSLVLSGVPKRVRRILYLNNVQKRFIIEPSA